MSADRTPRHIILDADTAAVVPEGATVQVPGGFAGRTGVIPPFAGSALTHIGGHPVEELVAAHDKATAAAEALRLDAKCDRDLGLCGIIQDAAADLLDRLRDLLIPQALVDAAHQQWAYTEGELS